MTLESTLDSLESLVRARFPESVAHASGPASIDEIAVLEERVGAAPANLKTLLFWQNGDVGGIWLGDGFWALLSSREIVQLLNSWQLNQVSGFAIGNFSLTATGMPAPLIPFASWNGGDRYAALIATGRLAGNVVGIDVVNGRAVIWDDSMESFMERVLTDISGGDELDLDGLPDF